MSIRTTQSGFSLIELLVSMTIFTVVMTITTGTLIVLIDSNAKAQSIQTAVSNLTFALDSMSREIRTGSYYWCSTDNGDTDPPRDDDPSNDNVVGDRGVKDCPNGNNLMSIIEAGDSLTGTGNSRISYYYDPDYYDPGSNHGAILRRLGTASWMPITSENVRITEMEFIVTGTDASNNARQPSVTIFVAGEAGDIPGSESDFAIQTTVVQRTLDI